jgi:hypothetical protein
MEMSRLRFTSLIIVCGLLGAGCGKGRSVLLVTVAGQNSGTQVVGIAKFVALLRSADKVGGPYTITPAGAPVMIPPSRQISFSFDKAISGNVTVSVQAIGADGVTLASGSATPTITPSRQAEVTVLLVPGAVPQGAYALRASAIGTLGPADTGGQYRVLDNGFEFGDHACAGAICVTGGVTP